MRKKRKDWTGETEALMQFIYMEGYESSFEQYNKYHFRLFGKKCKVDVWPGSKTYWVVGTYGSRHYHIINEIKPYLDGSKHPTQKK